MFCEAFHRVFKYSYLKGKQNRRVDKCLINLLKYNKDKMFDRIVKLTKGKMTQRLKMIQERHQHSLRIDLTTIARNADITWSVKSKNEGRVYIVALLNEKCQEEQCALVCHDCNICIHTYQCTCTDFFLYCTVCKHIHSVHRYREESEARQDNDIGEEHRDFGNECSHAAELDGLVNMAKRNKEETNIEILKRNAESALLAIIGSLKNNDERHIDAIRHLTKSANSLRHTFESMVKETKVV